MNIYFVTMYFCTMSRVAFDFIYYGKKTKQKVIVLFL